MASTFEGVFPAMVTPMTADEEVDCSTLPELVNRESKSAQVTPPANERDSELLTAAGRPQV